MAFLHANYIAPDRGVHPDAYGRVVLYQWVREGSFHFVYEMYHDEVAAGGRNGGNPVTPALTPRHDFIVRDTPAVLASDGVTVVTPASRAYTDRFSDAALRLSGKSPAKACYEYLLTQPLGVGAVVAQ